MAERQRTPRPYRDRPEVHRAHRIDDRLHVIVIADRDTAARDDDVAERGIAERVPEVRRVVAGDAELERRASARAHRGRERVAVRIADLPRRTLLGDVD